MVNKETMLIAMTMKMTLPRSVMLMRLFTVSFYPKVSHRLSLFTYRSRFLICIWYRPVRPRAPTVATSCSTNTCATPADATPADSGSHGVKTVRKEFSAYDPDSGLFGRCGAGRPRTFTLARPASNLARVEPPSVAAQRPIHVCSMLAMQCAVNSHTPINYRKSRCRRYNDWADKTFALCVLFVCTSVIALLIPGAVQQFSVRFSTLCGV